VEDLGPSGFDHDFGWGLLDPGRLVEILSRPAAGPLDAGSIPSH
jgi:hypothetical protein